MEFPLLNEWQWLAVGALFVWTGFVRTGLGFGGAALGLPLLLFIIPEPVFWLPVIAIHLLFFSGITLSKRLGNVDWGFLRQSLVWITPPALVGVFGLVTLPAFWLNVFIYSLSLFYGVIWLMNYALSSHSPWVDRFWLVVGGYAAGTSLTGAPLMVAVFMRNVARSRLRDTLFVLWFILVSVKMATFIALSVEIYWLMALLLIPVAAIGHVAGLRVHEVIVHNDVRFKRWVGGGLALVSALGLWSLVG